MVMFCCAIYIYSGLFWLYKKTMCWSISECLLSLVMCLRFWFHFHVV
uniref:Uncharacterized protein n=1 Tax=Arundo donax TaxID=35708 RepID=A0A0A9D867_ARUDO